MISRSIAWFCGAALVSIAGCGTPESDPAIEGAHGGVAPDAATLDAAAPDAMGAEPTAFQFYASLAAGGQPGTGVFDALGDVHLNARGALGVVPDDYYFWIAYEVCPPGAPQDTALASTDAMECRRFRVNAAGQIEQGPPASDGNGDACTHATATDLTPDNAGGLTLRVMPFEVSAYPCSDTFRINVTRYPLPFFDTDATVGFTVQARFPQPSTCGDGIVDAAEGCDDGNLTDGDGCSATCAPEPTAPVCGNGYVEPGEACDDGNLDPSDGCSASCEVEHLCCCGNGTVEPGEACDDGNHLDGDGCSASCQLEP